jgi:hypothetical protein
LLFGDVAAAEGWTLPWSCANCHHRSPAAGLIDRRDEATLMTRFGVVVTPAVVYVRDAEPVELVARMRDWPVFAQACDRLLAPGDGSSTPDIGGNA